MGKMSIMRMDGTVEEVDWPPSGSGAGIVFNSPYEYEWQDDGDQRINVRRHKETGEEEIIARTWKFSAAQKRLIGHTITAVEQHEMLLVLTLDDGTEIQVYDGERHVTDYGFCIDGVEVSEMK